MKEGRDPLVGEELARISLEVGGAVFHFEDVHWGDTITIVLTGQATIEIPPAQGTLRGSLRDAEMGYQEF